MVAQKGCPDDSAVCSPRLAGVDRQRAADRCRRSGTGYDHRSKSVGRVRLDGSLQDGRRDAVADDSTDALADRRARLSPDPSAPASGTANKISITDARFSVATLAAPADKTWTLQVDFKDPLGAHNFTLESGPSVAERVFQSPKFGTGKHDYVVPGLPAGNYVFVCTLHPETMHGVVEIG